MISKNYFNKGLYADFFAICYKKKIYTTNVRRLGTVKDCPRKNMVIVGPYLTYHDHLV